MPYPDPVASIQSAPSDRESEAVQAFDFGQIAVQDPAAKTSERFSKLESKVFVDPPLEEYPEVVFHKARLNSEEDDVLLTHTKLKK